MSTKYPSVLYTFRARTDGYAALSVLYQQLTGAEPTYQHSAAKDAKATLTFLIMGCLGRLRSKYPTISIIPTEPLWDVIFIALDTESISGWSKGSGNYHDIGKVTNPSGCILDTRNIIGKQPTDWMQTSQLSIILSWSIFVATC